MTDFVVNAVAREDEGKGASRRLRREGLVPAVLYGGDKRRKPVAISVHNNELVRQLQEDAFYSSILTLKLNDKEERVILKDLQRHPSKPAVLHADFQRVDSSQPIHTKVALHFVNAETSPAVKLSAAVISHVLNELDVSCLPGQLPEFIEVDLANLEAGQSIHVNDLKLPEGVTALTHGQNLTIVTSSIPRGAVAAEAEANAEEKK